MKSPWKFKCKNIHIYFDAHINYETIFMKTPGIFRQLLKQTSCEHSLLMTVSSIDSTCYSAEDYRNSREMILKAVVKLDDKNYYFPIAAFVDQPHSLFRGYLLGYNKEISTIEYFQGNANFSYLDTQNTIAYSVTNQIEKEISLYPHLTYRDYRTQDFEFSGLTVLNIEDLKSSIPLRCTLTDVQLPFLRHLGIIPSSLLQASYIEDSFLLLGAKYV